MCVVERGPGPSGDAFLTECNWTPRSSEEDVLLKLNRTRTDWSCEIAGCCLWPRPRPSPAGGDSRLPGTSQSLTHVLCGALEGCRLHRLQPAGAVPPGLSAPLVTRRWAFRLLMSRRRASEVLHGEGEVPGRGGGFTFQQRGPCRH